MKYYTPGVRKYILNKSLEVWGIRKIDYSALLPLEKIETIDGLVYIYDILDREWRLEFDCSEIEVI